MKPVSALTVAVTEWTAVSACASLDSRAPDQIRGTSGPIAWEVVDVRQTVAHDQREIRWDYSRLPHPSG